MNEDFERAYQDKLVNGGNSTSSFIPKEVNNDTANKSNKKTPAGGRRAGTITSPSRASSRRAGGTITSPSRTSSRLSANK